jgi:segregation and condensation protein B
MTPEELKPIVEAIIFMTADEPITFKRILEILEEESEPDVTAALDALVRDYAEREGGIELRQVAGGYRFSTRPEHSEYIRRFYKQQPTARLSMAALETLAVIAYKQPVTIPEILEIRGVSSSSAIKTLLDKRLIVAKGRKKVVGRPMMYGTSKEFLVQFGINDVSELPSLEDFEDLVTA